VTIDHLSFVLFIIYIYATNVSEWLDSKSVPSWTTSFDDQTFLDDVTHGRPSCIPATWISLNM